jgi:hypothetical protein
MVQFSGGVARGENFVHPLPDGLEFRLVAQEQGWLVEIDPPGGPQPDYAAIATPPYHGTNPTDIEAWHFRNADNTGLNEGDVNAPGGVRDFSFVLDAAQYKKFSNALSIWSGDVRGATQKQQDDAMNFLTGADRQDGSLTILDMKLGGLEKGTRPWFESMKFKVGLCFPAGTDVGVGAGEVKKSP